MIDFYELLLEEDLHRIKNEVIKAVANIGQRLEAEYVRVSCCVFPDSKTTKQTARVMLEINQQEKERCNRLKVRTLMCQVSSMSVIRMEDPKQKVTVWADHAPIEDPIQFEKLKIDRVILFNMTVPIVRRKIFTEVKSCVKKPLIVDLEDPNDLRLDR